ncbi:MAG: gamma-glutamyl-gamma-aminobutyrate hydrolase family protein [Nocardioidaceae bacterium]
MTRPLIGIAPRFLADDEGAVRDAGARKAILDCIWQAGGQPTVLYVADPAEAAETVSRVAAMVFPGGGDSDPAYYGDSERHPKLRLVHPLQDTSDMAMLNAAIARSLPSLAICRGMQTLNIVRDGSLVQHLEPGEIDHQDSTHEITVTQPGSQVSEMMGAGRFVGRSHHQQVVKELGRDLVITARSSDDLVEAIEHRTAPIVGLQWHPELATSDGRTQSEPFEWLVQMAHKYN